MFLKLNTSSVKLTAFDVVVAQLEDRVGQSLHDMVEEVRVGAPAIERYGTPSNLVLEVAAYRQDFAATQASFLRLDLDRLHDAWPEIVAGIQFAVSFLEEERVFDEVRLPAIRVLGVIAALHEHVPTSLDSLGEARRLLRRYLWRAFLTGRYDSSVGPRALNDYRGLRDLLTAQGGEPPIFDEDAHPLPDVNDLMQAGWPKTRETLARGVLAVSLRMGAWDLADQTPVRAETMRQREYHHVFPKSVLMQDGGVTRQEADRALNCILIAGATNRNISSKTPWLYLQDRVERTAFGEVEIQRRLATHLVPYEELLAADYDEDVGADALAEKIKIDYHKFLNARAELMLDPIASLCSGQEPDSVA